MLLGSFYVTIRLCLTGLTLTAYHYTGDYLIGVIALYFTDSIFDRGDFGVCFGFWTAADADPDAAYAYYGR